MMKNEPPYEKNGSGDARNRHEVHRHSNIFEDVREEESQNSESQQAAERVGGVPSDPEQSEKQEKEEG